MTHRELLDRGIKTFGFHPDEPFKSVYQILETARKTLSYQQYNYAVAVFANAMAIYCDERDIKEKPL